MFIIHDAHASSYRDVTKRRNRKACKIGNGESIIAVMYLSRNYKVACPTTSVIARSDQESPLMRRCHSFPARKSYTWVGTRNESAHLYTILYYVYILKTSNNFYTKCLSTYYFTGWLYFHSEPDNKIVLVKMIMFRYRYKAVVRHLSFFIGVSKFKRVNFFYRQTIFFVIIVNILCILCILCIYMTCMFVIERLPIHISIIKLIKRNWK